MGQQSHEQIPAFAFREVYDADAMDPDFAARLKLNGNTSTMKDNVLAVERHAGWATRCPMRTRADSGTRKKCGGQMFTSASDQSNTTMT